MVQPPNKQNPGTALKKSETIRLFSYLSGGVTEMDGFMTEDKPEAGGNIVTVI